MFSFKEDDSVLYWQQLGVGISWVKQINIIEWWRLCNNNKVTSYQSWTHLSTLTQLPINYGFNSTKSVFSTRIGRTMQHASFLVSNDHYNFIGHIWTPSLFSSRGWVFVRWKRAMNFLSSESGFCNMSSMCCANASLTVLVMLKYVL